MALGHAIENDMDLGGVEKKIRETEFFLERMREFQAEGRIGELCDPAFTFMGGIYSARKVREELAPKIVEELRSRNVEAFYLVPA